MAFLIANDHLILPNWLHPEVHFTSSEALIIKQGGIFCDESMNPQLLESFLLWSCLEIYIKNLYESLICIYIYTKKFRLSLIRFVIYTYMTYIHIWYDLV